MLNTACFMLKWVESGEICNCFAFVNKGEKQFKCEIHDFTHGHKNFIQRDILPDTLECDLCGYKFE